MEDGALRATTCLCLLRHLGRYQESIKPSISTMVIGSEIRGYGGECIGGNKDSNLSSTALSKPLGRGGRWFKYSLMLQGRDTVWKKEMFAGWE